MKPCSCPENLGLREEEEARARLTTSETQAVNGKLIKAIRVALQAECAHRASPAWATLNVYYETAFHDDDDEKWAMRFLRMTPGDYSIRWDVSLDVWSSDGSISFTGHEIAQQCARWIEMGWDFDTHDVDEDPCAYDVDDVPHEWNKYEALIDQEGGDEDFFPLPLPGEIVRRVWAHKRSGTTVLRYLDIRRTDQRELYEYVVQEEGNPSLIAHSAGLLECSVLKLMVQAEALPVTASPPYFLEAGRWFDEAKKAALKQTKPNQNLGFCTGS